jgi:hypothetical protein
MNNALSKLKYGWKNICKRWLQERIPYPLRFTIRGARYALCGLLFLWTLKTDTVLMERIEEELKCKGGQRIVRNPALR